jgi:3-mercaptopyruvate sulfurtransferase SseA
MRRRSLIGLTAALSVACVAARAQVPADPGAVPRMSLAEFRKALEAGTIVAVDVRAVEAYRSGHIPGALSVPGDQVEARAKELRATGKPLVTYCT